jgi:hypothetical protein
MLGSDPVFTCETTTDPETPEVVFASVIEAGVSVSAWNEAGGDWKMMVHVYSPFDPVRVTDTLPTFGKSSKCDCIEPGKLLGASAEYEHGVSGDDGFSMRAVSQ